MLREDSRGIRGFLPAAADRRGTVAVEYAVIVGTLSGAIVASFYGLGGKLITLLTNLPI